MTACIVGCVVKTAHTSTCGQQDPCRCQCHNGGMEPACDVPGGCWEAHKPASPCDGCRPVEAVPDEALCLHCRTRLVRAINVARDLIVHLRVLVDPMSTRTVKAGRDDIAHPKKPEAPAPLNLVAIDAADLIFADLVTWTQTACDVLEMSGPEMPRVWRTAASHGDAVGLVAHSTGEEVGPVINWLRTHLDLIVQHDLSAEMITGQESIASIIERALCAFPMEDKPEYLPKVRCLSCDRQTVRLLPPETKGGASVLHCTGCGAMIREDQYDPDRHRILTDREQEERAKAMFAVTAVTTGSAA